MTFPLDAHALEAAERAIADVSREYAGALPEDAAYVDQAMAEAAVRAYLAAEPLRAGIARLSQVGLSNAADGGSCGVPYQAWLPDDRNAA